MRELLGRQRGEWSARRTRNPSVLGLSPALATCWICFRSSQVQILRHACKQPAGCLLPVASCYVVVELFVSKNLSGVPVN